MLQLNKVVNIPVDKLKIFCKLIIVYSFLTAFLQVFYNLFT